MFCVKCGKELSDKAIMCPYCKTFFNNKDIKKLNRKLKKGVENNYALLGFIFSFFLTIPGFICSVLGYYEAKNNNAPLKGFAVAGIVISIVFTIIFFVSLYFLINPILDLIF